MKLGEKLQQLRKQSGLSQEQLAARLTVSRQAVSKWELDDAMPDTENVIQLSRLFGVSCDYLLRDEVEEAEGTGAAIPAAEDRHSPLANDRSGGLQPPGGTHLNARGWTRNAIVLSLALCTIGLIMTASGWLSYTQYFSGLLIAAGLMIQVLALGLFELATPRMGGKRDAAVARVGFYMIACWLVSPTLIVGLWWLGFWEGYFVWLSGPTFLFFDIQLSALVTALLAVVRQKLLGRI